jgi:hypothetical protein
MEEKLNYQLSTSVNEGILEIVLTGELTKYDIDMIRAEIIEIIRNTSTKVILCDVRSARGPQDITEAYYRSRSLPTDIKILPSAIVDRSENWDYKKFYEDTAANAGHSLKWFTDVESARAWLKNML